MLEPSSDLIHEGDRVLLYLDSRRMWLVSVHKNSAKFHTHAGIVDLSSLVGRRYGESVVTTLSERIVLLRPVVVDYVMKSERRTQIVYPKDFSYIGARSGLRNGSQVLECGTGSGALTSYFASLVSPDGCVHSFEERAEFFEIAKRNLEKASLKDFVKFENTNLLGSNSVKESWYDLALLDTGDPWVLIPTAHKALRGSGFLFSICPTTNQLEAVATAMKGTFCDIESVEILLRHIEAREGKTRPSMRMVGHTCYLISGRKMVTEPEAVENVK